MPLSPERSAAEALLAAYVERRGRGDAVTPEELCRDEPDLLEPLRELIAEYEEIERALEGNKSPPPEQVPVTISRYRVLERLGAGGMGIVYRAEDPTLGRTVAIKVLAPTWLLDAKARERFQREARAAAALEHPNICTVYEVGTTDEGRPFLAMPCYRGETLAARIARGPLPPDRALDLALQITAGLACAHDHGIVHRDVKPANLWVTDGGVVKILDFGLAKRPEQESLTVAGARLGTAAYMPPEQIRGGAVDARADVWACCVVLLEMLTGRPPFGGASASAEESLYRIVHGRPDGLADIPEAIARVLAKALAKEPAGRHADAGELRTALAGVRRNAGATLAEEGSPVAGAIAGDGEGEHRPSSGPSATRSWRSLAARPRPLAAAALVAAAIGLALWGRHGDGADTPPVMTPAPVAQPSLAVLPLENLGTPDQQQFADGMTEAITTQLAKIEALKVISRSAVQPYRTERPRPSQIARELGVTSLVEGSALLVGDRVRITAQLIDGASDRHLWAESYEGDLGDVLALQSRVAQAIARAVRVRVTPDEERRIAASRPIRPDAYRAYVDGLFHLESTRTDAEMFSSLRASIAAFEEAARLEPDWGEAHGKLARAHTTLAGMSDDHAERLLHYRLARQAAERALELDPGVVSARMVLGRTLLFLDGDWEGAEREYREALRLEPNHTEYTFASVLSWAGRTEEALANLRQARERWPTSVNLWFQAGLTHLCGGNPAGATSVASELRVRYGDTIHSSLLDAMVATRRGDYEGAMEILERQREALLVNRATSFHDTYSYAAAKAGRRDLAERSIDELEGLGGRASPSALLALGDAEAARRTIEERYRTRDYSLLAARCWPEYENLKRLPGVEAILREVGPPDRR